MKIKGTKNGKFIFKDISPNATVTINGKDWREILLEQNKPSKYSLKNIWSFLIGNARYKLFYSKFAFLIRSHIREQIQIRINSMDRQCYDEGQCKLCGCQTTALQMANKACDKPCYPKMVTNRLVWEGIRDGDIGLIDHEPNGLYFTRWNIATVNNKKVFMRVGADLGNSYDNGELLPELVRPQEEWVDENEKILQSVDLDNQKTYYHGGYSE